MKPIVAGVLMMGSVVAGAFGGMAGGSLFGPANPAAPPPAVIPSASQSDDDPASGTQDRSLEAALEDLRARQADELAALRRQLQVATDRLTELENARLGERVAALDRKLQGMPAAPAGPVAADGGQSGTAGPTVAADSPEFQAALEAALERRDEQRRQEEQADRRRRMEEGMARATQTILDTLAEKVSLTDDQKTRISVILDEMAKQRMDVMERGRQARENNQEFDWPGEMQAVGAKATETVRAELDASQQAAFDQAVGEQGLDSLAWGGGRGFGGPPRR